MKRKLRINDSALCMKNELGELLGIRNYSFSMRTENVTPSTQKLVCGQQHKSRDETVRQRRKVKLFFMQQPAIWCPNGILFQFWFFPNMMTVASSTYYNLARKNNF